MQELPPFLLIFALLFNFISSFFIATSHLYVEPLHCTPKSHYVAILPHTSTSQSYITLLYYTNVALLPRSITLPPPHITPRVKSGARAISDHKVNYSIECTWLCNKSRLFLRFSRHSLRHFLDPSWSRPSY
jgi:hypothetical protein